MFFGEVGKSSAQQADPVGYPLNNIKVPGRATATQSFALRYLLVACGTLFS
jgi:hypothetical protein